jgi:ribokinase
MSIVVFGSLNMDLVAQTRQLPRPGESLVCRHFFTAPGGKGANQAVAAARLGVNTQMIGRVGRDRFGEELLASLQESSVKTEGVLSDPETHSGVAVIAVGDRGENQIIVVPGANGCVGFADVERLVPLLSEAKVLLLQLEIPLPAVQAAAEVAQQAGVTVILDPAPAPATLPAELLAFVDILTPNEVEASQLFGFPVGDRETATQAAREFLRRGAGTAIVKLGDRGLVCATPSETYFIPPFPVTAIDTVAAGDAFNGALAAALARGRSLQEALTWGAAAGALASTQVGAQPSLPERDALEIFLQRCSGSSSV